MGSPRHQSQGHKNPQRRLHSLLLDLTQFDKVTNLQKWLCTLRSTPYDTDSVALEEQLGVPESQEKVIPVPRLPRPHLKWWLQEENVLQGQPLHPSVMLCKFLQTHRKKGGALTRGNTLQGEVGPCQNASCT